jgi:hypothetical protein
MAQHVEFGASSFAQPAATPTITSGGFAADPAGLSVSPARGPEGGPAVNGGTHRLPELVARAETATQELHRLARTVLEASAAGSHTASELQERLRLGVRMLQAFDVQIQRGEQTGQQLVAQLGPQLQAFIAEQAQLEIQRALATHATPAIEAIVSAAVERALEPIRNTAPPPAAAEPEIAERLAGLIASADAKVADLDARFARADEAAATFERRCTDAADALLGTVGTATTLKELVSDELRVERQRSERCVEDARDAGRELVAIIERCMLVKSELSAEVARGTEEIRRAEERLSAVRSLEAELDAMLVRLAPWESLVRRDGAPAPHVVETVARSVRQGMSEELRSFSEALRSLASKADAAFSRIAGASSFSNGRFDEFSPARPEPTRSEPAATSETTAVPHAPPAPSTGAKLPIDTRHLTAEILALDATSLLGAKTQV